MYILSFYTYYKSNKLNEKYDNLRLKGVLIENILLFIDRVRTVDDLSADFILEVEELDSTILQKIYWLKVSIKQ